VRGRAVDGGGDGDRAALPPREDVEGGGHAGTPSLRRSADARRFQRLLVATQALSADVELPVLLHRLVDAACELVGARYGALGVVAPDGSLSQFVTAGVDQVTASAIGDLPRGKGLLGHLVQDSRPLRLEDLADHPSSAGLPAGHPPMRSFLGVPVRVRDRVYGNLYLTEKHDGGRPVPFSAEDEEVLVALAAAAGVAIANARLLHVAQRRQRWLRASAEVVQDLLVGRVPALSAVVRRARAAGEAELGAVLVVDPDDNERLQLVAADGEADDVLRGTVWPRRATLAGQVLEDDEDLLVDDVVEAGLVAAGLVAEVPGMPNGPAMLVRISRAGPSARPGVVALIRERGRVPFDEQDRAMASDFARNVELALELQQAQIAQRSVALVDDRARIARDLHDHVIQQLFASGLRLSALAGRLEDSDAAAVLRSVVDDGDDTIRTIRSTIFDLQHVPSPDLRQVVRELVEESTEVLGFRPSLAVDGPLPAVVDLQVLAGVRAVLRELLTNVARHARASQVSVHLATPGDHLELTVVDDGVGLQPTGRRSGLGNAEHRARSAGGRCTVASPVDGDRGTRVWWSVPLAPPTSPR